MTAMDNSAEEVAVWPPDIRLKWLERSKKQRTLEGFIAQARRTIIVARDTFGNRDVLSKEHKNTA